MSRHRTSPAPAPAPPLEDEDLLREVLLRLPPKPSSFPRASLVCKRWRSILLDPRFLGCFRKHHRKPPLLGFFEMTDFGGREPVFTPLLDSPDRIPADCFIGELPQGHWRFLGCRHGLTVLINQLDGKVLVWDPLSGRQYHVTFPPGITVPRWASRWYAAVLGADAEDGHAHGGFKLVVICEGAPYQTFACVYESVSGVWGDTFLMETTEAICPNRPSILVGNALYWLFYGGDVLVFDLERQSLGVIKKPANTHVTDYYYRCTQLLRREDGGLGLAVLSELTMQLWEGKSNSDGVVGWVPLQKTILSDWMLPLGMPSDDKMVFFVGYDEDTNVIFLTTMIGKFMLQLDSMEIKHVIKRENICYDTIYPFTSFYTAGREVGWI